MAILRRGTVPETPASASYPAPHTLPASRLAWRHLTEAGGLTQFGVALETLHPGGQSSQPHWEQHEDEFLYLLSGALTVIEDDVETVIAPGDACCWPANTPVAHALRNDSDQPAVYLIAGSRDPANITHYPGLDLMATPQGYVHLNGTPYPTKGETE